MGGRIYGPYTGRHYRSFRKDTDIEHLVAVSEAHDSGLCAAGPPLRRRFASDLLNLTLAAPEVNRCSSAGKCAYDPGEWLPPMNRCWFAARVVAVKRKYALTIDRREATALERVLSGCTFDGDDRHQPPTAPPSSRAPSPPPPPSKPMMHCACGTTTATDASLARRRGATASRRCRADIPAYPFMFDRDGDGVVCE